MRAAVVLALIPSPALAQINAGEQKPDVSPPFALTQVAAFNLPWRMAFLPDGRMLVTEKVGPIWLVTPQGQKQPVQNYPAVLYGGRGGAKPAERWDVGHRIRDIEVAPDGSVWLLENSVTGGLFQLTPR